MKYGQNFSDALKKSITDYTDFYEAHLSSAALHGDLLYRISPKLVKKCGKYG
jgi:hypothetical protein